MDLSTHPIVSKIHYETTTKTSSDLILKPKHIIIAINSYIDLFT